MRRLLWLPLLMVAALAVAVPMGWEYDALDFGAIPNDGVDDTARLQAAIDFIEANGGGQLRIPAGTYMFSSALTIDSDDVSLVGEGMDATILRAAEDSINGIHVDNANNVIIRDLQVRNVELTGAAERRGIYVESSNNVTVSHCRVDSCDDAGISISYDASGGWDSVSTNCRVLYNVVSNTNEGTGIEIIGADSCLVVGNKVLNPSQIGIRLCGATNTIVMGNRVTVEGTSKACVQVQGGGDGGAILADSRDNLIIANMLYADEARAVQVFNRPERIRIESNEIHGDSSSSAVGVFVWDGGGAARTYDYRDIEIVNNSFYGTDTPVKLQDDGQRVRIAGNKMLDYGGGGAAVHCNASSGDTLTHVFVTGNYWRNMIGGDGVSLSADSDSTFIRQNTSHLADDGKHIVKSGTEIDWEFVTAASDTVRTNIEIGP